MPILYIYDINKIKRLEKTVEKYRRKLRLLAYCHNIVGRFRYMISSMLIVWAILIIYRSLDIPSYSKEYLMWAIAATLILLGFFIFKKGHVVFYNQYMKLQKEALGKYPHLYENNHTADQQCEYSTKSASSRNADTKSSSKNEQPASFQNASSPDFFAGTTDAVSIKKRYKELLKIYHPDNGSGDASTSAVINQQYKERLKTLAKENV